MRGEAVTGRDHARRRRDAIMIPSPNDIQPRLVL